jgi:hypothetical protein
MSRRGGSILQRAASAAALVDGRLTLLGRRDNPLHFAETPGGLYFGSLPDALPGRPIPLPGGYAGVLTVDVGGLRLEARQLGG